VPGTDEWEILPLLEVHAGDMILPKTANDAFYRTSLKQMLQDNGISEIVATGCATDFCVDTTIKSALANDFDVTVIADCHTTANRPNIDARLVVNYYNWLWSEMIPTEGQIKVVEFARYSSLISYLGYE
jgi:nicotinamidase-related amidase